MGKRKNQALIDSDSSSNDDSGSDLESVSLQMLYVNYTLFWNNYFFTYFITLKTTFCILTVRF